MIKRTIFAFSPPPHGARDLGWRNRVPECCLSNVRALICMALLCG
ncbi:MAG TPA: hypothetical protein VFS55_06350 [Dokdonella sp.]|nr:hypothetical protein [Dokdonella sp.]